MQESPLLQIEKLAGVGRKDMASAIFTSRATIDDESSANLASCIIVADAGGQDAQVLARDIFEITTKKLEGATEVLSELTAARDKVRDHLSTQEVSASFVTIVFWRQAAYIVRLGEEVKVYVASGKRSAAITVESGSGPVSGGQIYLVATAEFIKKFKVQEELADLGNLEEAVDGWATEVSALDDSSRIAAALVKVKGDGEKGEKDEHEGQDHQESNETEDIKGSDGIEDSNETKEIANNDESTRETVSPRESLIGRVKLLTVQKFSLITSSVKSEIRKIRTSDKLAISRLRRNLVLVAAVILIILGISAGFAVKSKKDKVLEESFNVHLLAAQTKYGEGEAIVGLNRERARKFFVEGQDEINKAIMVKPKDEKALEVKSKIEAALRDTENLASVAFSTLAEVDSPQFLITGLGKKLVGVADGKIYTVDVASKTVGSFNGVDGPRAAFGSSDSIFVLADNGVYKVDPDSKKSEKVADAKGAYDIGIFVGNVYLLAAANIYKYVPVEKGYVASADYLSGASFTENSRMAIDGSIWVTKGDKIFKYLKGVDQNFTISGLSSSVGQFGIVYTTGDLSNIYVVDRANRALLSINKEDGIFKKAYQAEEFSRATGLVIDEKMGKMYVAVDDKILVAGL